jgi:hypothetical protein
MIHKKNRAEILRVLRDLAGGLENLSDEEIIQFIEELAAIKSARGDV